MGPYRGCRGYAQGWDNLEILVDVFFQPSPEVPSMSRQLVEPAADLGRISLPPQFIQRCFLQGDQVFKKGLPNARFFVHHGDSAGNPHLIQDQHDLVPIARMRFEPALADWITPDHESSFCLVHRKDLIMADTIHDPKEAKRMGHIHKAFRVNWEVTVVKGPLKGYNGRVRKIWHNGVDVELQATQKVLKIKPELLMRRK